MKNKKQMMIPASNLASDLALQLQKARGLLDGYPDSESMQSFGRGCMSTVRQMIKWQVWSNREFIPLIVREYRRVRLVYPNVKR
jgi:hypothetical protein